MRKSELYLNDILEAIKAIENFVEGLSFEDFKKDDLRTSAVIRKFEIIGEAARQIPDETKQKYPDVPWKRMAGMRDRLIHFYFGIKYEIVWETIKEDLPKLKILIEKILKDLEEGK